MSDNPKVSLGFYVLPFILTNFSTDEKGNNEIGAEYIKFCAEVYRQTTTKLLAAGHKYFNEQGVDVEYLTKEDVAKYAKQMVGNESDSPTIIGIVTPEGKIIEDEHAAEALCAGKRFDN